MNIDELVELFKLKSGFQNNKEIHAYIKNFLNNNGIPFNVDDDGNIFNISNIGRPLFSAHTDTVRKKKDDNVAKTNIKVENGENELHIIHSPGHVLGGDDMCGVYTILSLLKEDKTLNFVFSNNEEISPYQTIRGFVNDNIRELKLLPYCIVLDRKGSSDVICYLNNYGSKEFEKDLLAIGSGFGYSQNRGLFSDADFLRNYISTANISCGYYAPHSEKEIVVFEHVEKTFNYCKEIVANIVESYEPNEETFSYAFERQIIGAYEKVYNSAFGRNIKLNEH